jgi:hypothetical protein
MNATLRPYSVVPVLEEVLRRRVCSICDNRHVDGGCDLDLRHECTLFERLPRITQSISRVRSEKIDDYITAIRESVCAECFHQHLDGSCQQREEGRCALDRHMVPIIWAIECYSAATASPAVGHQNL